jgi:hypothetical protein
MSYETRLMFCGTAGRWSGDIGTLDNSIQQVAERLQIPQGQYNASSHYSLRIHGSGAEYIPSVGTDMSESQGGELSQYRNVERPVAKRFGNAIGVYCRRLIRLMIGHC